MPPRYWRASLSFNAPGEKPSRGADLDCDMYSVSWVDCSFHYNPKPASRPSGTRLTQAVNGPGFQSRFGFLFEFVLRFSPFGRRSRSYEQLHFSCESL